MIDTQSLLNKVNCSLRKNLGKEIIALLLVFFFSVMLAPLALVFAFFVEALPVTFILLLLIPILLFMLQISFAQMCGKMYREDPCVLGNLLDSFRDWKRCGSLALIYSLSAVIICSVVMIGGMVVLYEISGGDATYFDSENAIATLLHIFPVMIMICMTSFFLLVLLPTSFTHLVLMDNKELTLKAAIQENSRLLRGEKGRLLTFLLRTGGLWLVGAVVFMVISFVIVSIMYQQGENATNLLKSLHLATQVCDVLYYICVYTSLIRLVTGVAVYYQAIREGENGVEAPLQIHQESTVSENPPSSSEEV